jgi:hypothetical protein
MSIRNGARHGISKPGTQNFLPRRQIDSEFMVAFYKIYIFQYVTKTLSVLRMDIVSRCAEGSKPRSRKNLSGDGLPVISACERLNATNRILAFTVKIDPKHGREAGNERADTPN